MRNWLHFTIVVACVTLAGVLGTSLTQSSITTHAQQQRPVDQQSPDTIVISKDEVPFDVVVKDKKGHVVRDLTASDFEVYEDGVKQEINSFKFVSAAENKTGAAGTNSSSAANKNNPAATESSTTKKPNESSEPEGVSVVALVFDRISAESRQRARDAALSYLGENVKKGELVGVFLTDLSVIVLQPFTNEPQLLKSGIEKFSLQAPSLYTSNNREARRARDEVTRGELMVQSGLVNPIPNTEFARAAAMELRNLEGLEEMERNEQGNATTHGLLKIASSLRTLPGRKAVIFFSEGLVLPPNAYGAFQSLVNAANRVNVSFYAIDVAGLRAESKTAETNREINSRSDLRMAQLGSSADTLGPMTKGLERNEDLLRLNPDSGLGQLASETGGFLITDSNDLKNRVQQIDEDLHSYYLLSYSSNNQTYDGHFRKIEVKLKRSGLTVQSRKGYYALKGTFGSPVLSYEVAALAALSNAPKSDSFPFFVGGFSFPDRQRIGLTPIMADLPMSAFTISLDQVKKIYDTDFSVVALIKNQAGQVVAKLSNQYRLNGPLDKVEEAKKGRLLFYREAYLPPDRYTMETVAYDVPSGRASVRTTTFEVKEADESELRLSDVMILKRAEPANGTDENRNNPFHVGDMIVNPNLGEPIQRSLKQVPFFFTVYSPAVTSTKPKLTIELVSAGRSLGQIPGELPAADALGRCQFVAALPVEKLPAGDYVLKIVVSDGPTSLTRSRSFTIVD
jgi:VWFA-related protein